MKGLFFTFEGPEGSGKSTHITLLYNYLKDRGFKVIKVREPGDTRIGEKIRRILLDADNQEIFPLTETLLYMACRHQLVKEKITPYLKKGYIVLCDRFLDSTFAYQGFGLGVDLNLIKSLAKYVCQDLSPDLTILLDIPVKSGLRHIKRKYDRIESRKLPFHRRLRKGYLKLAKLYPERIKIIRVEKDPICTQDKIRETVCKKICLLKK